MTLLELFDEDLDGKKAHVKKQLKTMITNQYSSIKQSLATGRTFVWENPEGLTPQQVFDAVGTDGAYLLSCALASVTLLNTLKANSADPTPPLPLTVDQDGTVTVG